MVHGIAPPHFKVPYILVSSWEPVQCQHTIRSLVPSGEGAGEEQLLVPAGTPGFCSWSLAEFLSL